VAQIIEALGFLHTKDIIYQDIKPENILLEKNGYVRLADFGAAKYVSQTKNYKTFVGTADYIAPEVLKKLPYTKTVDWWGLGILIYELLYGKTPYFNKNTKISFRMILTEKPVFPDTRPVSDLCKDFIEQLLNKDHLKRLGASKDDNMEIRKHPWLAVIDFDKLLNFELQPPIIPEVKDDLDVDNFNSKYTAESTRLITSGPKMTMLNEEIVKEMAKYDDLFNGFSYNDIIQEKFEDDEDREDENNHHEIIPDTNQAEGEGQEDSSDDSDNEGGPLAEALNNEELGLRQKKKPTGSGTESIDRISGKDVTTEEREMTELSPSQKENFKESDKAQPAIELVHKTEVSDPGLPAENSPGERKSSNDAPK
jgi:serine/threonine protein kinase